MANSSFEFAGAPPHNRAQMNPDGQREFEIRPYAPGDRLSVRTLCCDTADCGEPVERFFPDREVFADLLTRYYTDIEPGSAWVVEQGGCVVGYLTGCVDTNRFERVMRFRIGPAVFLKALARGTFLQAQVRSLLRANWRSWMNADDEPRLALAPYPSHLHVNLARSFRGQGAGRRLVQAFCEYAKANGSRGVHANVREDNEKGRHAFERMGFKPIHRKFLMNLPGDRTLWTVVYGRSLG